MRILFFIFKRIENFWLFSTHFGCFQLFFTNYAAISFFFYQTSRKSSFFLQASPAYSEWSSNIWIAIISPILNQMQRAARIAENVNRKAIRHMTSIQCHFEQSEAIITNRRGQMLKRLPIVPKLATEHYYHYYHVHHTQGRKYSIVFISVLFIIWT